MIQFSVVSGKPRYLQSKNHPNPAQAHLSHQSFKAASLRTHSARDSEVLVDDLYVSKTQPLCPVDQLILSGLTLQVMLRLILCLLPDVYIGSPGQMLRLDDVTPHFFPP